VILWEDRRCPQCLHWWVCHGEPGERGYGCTVIESSMAERAAMANLDRESQHRGVPPEVARRRAYRDLRTCDCAFAEGNTVTPRQVQISSDGTSDPTPPWQRHPGNVSH
jgi:hypothetical protein